MKQSRRSENRIENRDSRHRIEAVAELLVGTSRRSENPIRWGNGDDREIGTDSKDFLTRDLY